MILSIPLTAILKVIFDTQASTKALGYFLGSELTDDKDDMLKHLYTIKNQINFHPNKSLKA